MSSESLPGARTFEDLAIFNGRGAFLGFLFLNMLYLQDLRGLSALQAGLYTLPLAPIYHPA